MQAASLHVCFSYPLILANAKMSKESTETSRRQKGAENPGRLQRAGQLFALLQKPATRMYGLDVPECPDKTVATAAACWKAP